MQNRLRESQPIGEIAGQVSDIARVKAAKKTIFHSLTHAKEVAGIPECYEAARRRSG